MPLSWEKSLRKLFFWPTRILSKRRRASYRPQLDCLEDKILLSGVSSAVVYPTYQILHPQSDTGHLTPTVGPGSNPAGYSPSQIDQAYGINAITFQSNGSTVAGNGAGQTIALIDAYDDPSIASDLAVFDQQYGLPAPPSFIKVGINASGTASTTNFPTPNAGWAGEIELDVEWTHAIAPGANILLVEAHSSSNNDLLAAINYARNYPGVAAVSMSWGGSDFSGQTQYDSYFTTPAGHTGVTFIGSTGDNGAPSGWPATSSHVLAAGGTSLTIDSSGDYISESGWSDSGGGLSQMVTQPSYQNGLVIHNGSQIISAGGMRAVPDVSFNADPDTGVAVYGTYGSDGWAVYGGTSAAAPAWAGLMAIVDQGRVASGKTALDGYTQTLPELYQLPASDFHEITSGNNGYAAGPGYNLVTGLGSPVANLLVPDLVSGNTSGSTPPTVVNPAKAITLNLSAATLSALGADTAGAASLTYTWAVTGTPPAAVSFSLNGTNAAQTTTATFSRAGLYTFQVTITDPRGLSVVSQVSYTVTAALTSVSVSPASATVLDGGTRSFTATGYDQFGVALASQPAFTWSIAAGGVGTVGTSGLFTAPASGTGTATIQATAGTLSGTASVSVVPATGPKITTTANASGQTATSVTLGVTATDPAGASSLTYTWTESSGPTGDATFSPNGTNAATTTVTFQAIGTYSFQVSIKDTFGLTATSTVNVTVSSVLTSITVAPGTVTVAGGGTQQFTATAHDQFNNTLSSVIIWSATAGTISSTGLFTAPTVGSSVTVTAASGGVQGQATVTIPGSSSGTLFTDNFESGGGKWTVDSGSYYLVTLSNGNHRLLVENYGGVSRAVAGSSTWTNYSIQATVTLLDNYGGSISLLGRVQDDNHLYFFGYDAALDAWMIARKDGPTVTTMLATGAPFAMQIGVDYTVQANLNGSSLSLSVNGVTQVTATDSTYTYGKIGFSATLASGTLDNVVVTALQSPSVKGQQVAASFVSNLGGSAGLAGEQGGVAGLIPGSSVGTGPASQSLVFGNYQGAISGFLANYWAEIEQGLFGTDAVTSWEIHLQF